MNYFNFFRSAIIAKIIGVVIVVINIPTLWLWITSVYLYGVDAGMETVQYATTAIAWILAGVGMWMMKRWGLYLTVVLVALSVLRIFLAIVIGSTSNMLIAGVIVALGVLLLIYFWKKRGDFK